MASDFLDSKPERFADIATALGEDIKGLPILEAAAKAVVAISTLSAKVGIPRGLSEIGVKEEDIPMLAELAMKDACSLFNPKKAELQDVIDILKAAF